MKPTEEFYNFWTYLYSFYNQHLFNSELVDVMITVTRKKNTMGYFSPKRWENNSDEENKQIVGELAMNPSFFKGYNVVEIMQTLVHEMCHVWQFQFGKVTKQMYNGYHNKQWANKMIEIGLYPSDTGKEGGKMLGYKMNDYVIENGLFQKTTSILQTLTDFKSLWVDVNPIKNFSVANVITLEDGEEIKEPKPKTKGKNKYSCGCTNIWGAMDIDIICNKCDNAFILV